MAIPKTIFQTFKTNDLPFLIRLRINRFRRNNPSYNYEFFDDKRIEDFLLKEFDRSTLELYQRINIGAAKADFFRYAVLLKYGGLYLDIDSGIRKNLDEFIRPDDTAIISRERNPEVFVQWALIFDKNHPFLQKTFNRVIENLAGNKYPHDVHRMTGPTVYSQSIKDCLALDPSIPHRVLGIDYNGYLKFKSPFSKGLYKKNEHWKKKQLLTPVIRNPQ
jgi:mannosyltransferase OCH1-like enzyme